MVLTSPGILYYPFKRQPQEYDQIADELFECVWPFCGLALKGLSFMFDINLVCKVTTNYLSKNIWVLVVASILEKDFSQTKNSLQNCFGTVCLMSIFV